MSEFQNKIVVVVGGARGIGRAVANQLGQLGAKLALVDLGTEVDGTGQDPEVVRQAALALRAEGVDALGLALDSATPAHTASMLESVRAHFGRVDLGVYCAGFRHERPLLRASEEEIEHVLGVHLFGAVRFTRELARVWVEQKSGGAVVLALHPAGLFGSAGQSALAIASGGLAGFVKTAATELRRHDIRVNAVLPTARTRLTEGLPLFTSIRADSLTAEHVAPVVCHLLSDAAADIRGEVIGVAGGRVYAVRHFETSGAFHEGSPPTLEEITASWRDVTKR